MPSRRAKGVRRQPPPSARRIRLAVGQPHQAASSTLIAKKKPRVTDRLTDFWLGETDIAPVCLFRLVYGALLALWLLQLLPDLSAFFTDEGVFPRFEAVTAYPGVFSVLQVMGAWWQVAIFWSAAMVVALMLAAGYRTRLVSFLAFVVVSSFEWRDPLITDGSDFVFRLIPLWLTFTAAGSRYSVDAAIRARAGDLPSRRGPSLPIRILELQIAWIYLASAVEKLAGRTWLDGTAMWYALQLSHTYARPFSAGLATFPVLWHAMTWGTLALELAFLPLAFGPGWSRTAALGAGVLLHGGILLLMNVGDFPLIMLAGLIPFLPAKFVEQKMAHAPGFGNRIASLLRSTRQAGPQTRAGIRMAGQAALVVVAGLSFQTALPSQLASWRPSGPLEQVLNFASVYQRWDMFAPDPSRTDWWMFEPAQLDNGTELDLITGQTEDDSASRANPFSLRWTKLRERVAAPEFSAYLLEYGRMHCRLRNLHLAAGQSALASFEVRFVSRTIPPPGEGPPAWYATTLWQHHC